jgi:gamma-glutamylcyclotransferase (GGCT)/AIG2-like uncharacterized protein YtfP
MAALFAYGTLQREDIQMDLFERTLEGVADRLAGFQLTAINLATGDGRYQQYPVIFATGNSNDVVEGIRFAVTEEDLLKADEYEGESYQRAEVILESGQLAWVYVAATAAGG